MQLKRRHSSTSEQSSLKRLRTRDPQDYISELSDELLIRILHHLPLPSLLKTHLLSHRFYTLSTDSQLWKSLYYNRFVLPRALRIPGIKTAQPEQALHFSNRRSKWLHEGTLIEGRRGTKTDWKRQYKLRHNWSIGACEVQEIRVKEQPSLPTMLVKLAEGVVITVDKEDGLRAWDLKGRTLLARSELEPSLIPRCLAVDEPESRSGELGIAIGFMNGGWGTWKLDRERKIFSQEFKHPPSSNGSLSAVAYSKPYVLTITESQLLSLYSFSPAPPEQERSSEEQRYQDDSGILTLPTEFQRHSEPSSLLSLPSPDLLLEATSLPKVSVLPRLLASLKSHTSWPPLSLSIRSTSSTIIASIAYSLPTYLNGYTIGLQELHLHPTTGLITSSRLTSALPPFSSLSSSSATTASPSPPTTSSTRPTTLSYNHPYILATHPDNTLTLYLCTSTHAELKLTSGTKLWGHTSSVASAEITARGKAVSVCGRGEELRVWELEDGGMPSSLKEARGRLRGGSEKSVMIRPERAAAVDTDDDGAGTEVGDVLRQTGHGKAKQKDNVWLSKRHWVGFDDEVVIVLRESARGAQALMVYDFT